MSYSEKRTDREQGYIDAGLPIQQVIIDGENPTDKELKDATDEMSRDNDTRDRG